MSMGSGLTVGKKGEHFAMRYLISEGMKDIEMNFSGRYGEVDIIGRIDEYIVFVEVKTRKKNSYVSGVESVNKGKQKRIAQTAFEYMTKNSISCQPRFDIIEIENDSKRKVMHINHIPNAFIPEGDYAFF